MVRLGGPGWGHATAGEGPGEEQELPAIGKAVKQGGDMAVVESVKAVSEVYAPVTGEVVAVNDELTGAPEDVIVTL